MQKFDEIKWKTIPNFSRYEASTTGLIRSLNYKNSKEVKILTPAISPDGYLSTMLLRDDGKYISTNIHRWIAATYLGLPNKREVNHIDGIKTNNSLSNLEYCSHSENIKHAYDLGLIAPKVGSLNGMAKLTEKQVSEIREVARNGGRYYGRKYLAIKYNVSECTIKEVVCRRRNKFYNVP